MSIIVLKDGSCHSHSLVVVVVFFFFQELTKLIFRITSYHIFILSNKHSQPYTGRFSTNLRHKGAYKRRDRTGCRDMSQRHEKITTYTGKRIRGVLQGHVLSWQSQTCRSHMFLLNYLVFFQVHCDFGPVHVTATCPCNICLRWLAIRQYVERSERKPVLYFYLFLRTFVNNFFRQRHKTKLPQVSCNSVVEFCVSQLNYFFPVSNVFVIADGSQ